jgi:hypothetical protein
MLDELEYPSRDLRIAAQVLNCRSEIESICRWLHREVEKAIETETMFDDVRESEPPAP